MLRRLCCLCLCLYLVLLPRLQAAPADWGASVVLSSDNLLRGTSRSSNDTAISGELHAQSGGWLAALWASSSRVRPADPATVEVSATFGYGTALAGDWSVRGSLSHYESPWQNRSSFYRYDEFTLDLRYGESLLLSASFSPNTSRYASAYGPVWKRNAIAYEATWQHELPRGLRGYAGVGYYDLSELFGDGYWYGSTGLNWTRGHWQVDAAYVIAGNRASDLSNIQAGGRRGLFSVAYIF